MLNTIFGVVGWIGTLLVFAGVAIRMFRPEWDQYAYWSAVAGLGVAVTRPRLSQAERSSRAAAWETAGSRETAVRLTAKQ